MNGLVIFLVNVDLVHPRLRGNSLVTIYGISEVSCMIPNKVVCMYEETWEKVGKVLADGISKM